MSQVILSIDTELRKLKPAQLYMLGQLLNVSDSWKKLMAVVPKDRTSNHPKFNADHFNMIEQAVYQQRRNGAEIFLDEWGTMGKNRPTLGILLDLLVKAELFRVADYVAADLLKVELPKRPVCGPAAPVDISDEALIKLLEEKAKLFDDNYTNESLVLGSASQISANKIVYPPDAMVDATNRNSLKENMLSTKLVFTGEDCNKQYLGGTSNTGGQRKFTKPLSKVNVSDLMKFSSDENSTDKACTSNAKLNNVKSHVEGTYSKQEMPSQELPMFLNDFEQSTEKMRINQEVQSDVLPTCLTSRTFSDDDSSSYSSDSWNVASTVESLKLDSSNLIINQNNLSSAELPQSVLESNKSHTNDTEITKNSQHNPQDPLTSQELPITILEYHR